MLKTFLLTHLLRFKLLVGITARDFVVNSWVSLSLHCRDYCCWLQSWTVGVSLLLSGKGGSDKYLRQKFPEMIFLSRGKVWNSGKVKTLGFY